MRVRRDRGLTLVEVLVALCVLSILLAIILPVYVSARRRGEDMTCLSNLRQTGLALSLYTADYDSHYPTAVVAVFQGDTPAQSDQTWRDMLLPYLKTAHFPECPIAVPSTEMRLNARAIDIGGYAYNHRLSQNIGIQTVREYLGRNEVRLNFPTLTVTVFDARPGILTMRGPDTIPHSVSGIQQSELEQEIRKLSPAATRHRGGANYVFADGHAKWFKPAQLDVQQTNDGLRPGFGL